MSTFTEFASIFLSRDVAGVNKAFVEAGSPIRLIEKVANKLRFKAGETTFQVTEQELLAADMPMLRYLKQKLEDVA